MPLQPEDLETFLPTFIARAAQAEAARIDALEQLGGGAIQENHALDVEISGGTHPGRQTLVLRLDAPSSLRVSLSRPQEFAVLRAAYDAGVQVPEPLWLHRDRGEIGRDFYLMRRVPGTANGRALVNREFSPEQRARLLGTLGENLARLHNLRPPLPELDFLVIPESSPALARVAEYRSHLDAMERPQPSLEWALRWLERNAPQTGECVLCHGDFRTGNYMVEGSTLTGILDWEFACWSDPREDLGWFCARCWRFGQWQREAGGIGAAGPLLRGYERVANRHIAVDELRYWQVMATVRWAIIALMQTQRHTSGEQPSLELALTGRILPELELDAIEQILDAERQANA